MTGKSPSHHYPLPPMPYRSAIDCNSIKPIAPYSHGGVQITIDGRPYCRVDDIHTARETVKMWTKNWPAVAGKKLEVIA